MVEKGVRVISSLLFEASRVLLWKVAKELDRSVLSWLKKISSSRLVRL